MIDEYAFESMSFRWDRLMRLDQSTFSTADRFHLNFK